VRVQNQRRKKRRKPKNRRVQNQRRKKQRKELKVQNQRRKRKKQRKTLLRVQKDPKRKMIFPIRKEKSIWINCWKRATKEARKTQRLKN